MQAAKFYGPVWLHTELSPEDKAMVQDWLTSLGADLDHCAGFDFDPASGEVRLNNYVVAPGGVGVMMNADKTGPEITYRVLRPQLIPDCLLESK